MPTQLKDDQTILFIGDSITDCSRRDHAQPLGNGYVKVFRDLVIAHEPEKTIHYINKGIGGDTVRGLRQRWSDDVIRHRPDWLSVKIGINDLHRVLTGDDPVSPDEFEACYTAILERTKSELPTCQILLITPFYMSVEATPNEWRYRVLELLPTYIGIVEKLSAQFATRLVKTHDIFQRLFTHYDTETFGPEPVHPNATGHLIIASAVYDALSTVAN